MGTNRKRIAVLVAASAVVLLALPVLLLLYSLFSTPGTPKGTGPGTGLQLAPWISPPDDLEDREAVDGGEVASETPEDGAAGDAGTAPGIPEDGEVPSIGGYAPWLEDPERFVLATGKFDVYSVPDNVDFVLGENADTYAPVTEAIKAVDPAFDPEGYLVSTHARDQSGGGRVTATLYVEGIKTSAHYSVVIDDGDIRYIDTISVYHPTAAEIRQVAKFRADFEASPAASGAIERAKAALRQAGGGVEPECSEYYFYDFNFGKLLLYVKGVYTYDMGDGMSASSANEEQIDCLEVLGR
jgi:hypothetical protein